MNDRIDTRVLSVPELAADGVPDAVRLDWVDGAGDHSVEVTTHAILGSSDHADVRLVDDTVSRLHAELQRTADGFWLRDLQSRNGTWLQGVRVERARIEGFARVRIGNVKVAIVPRATVARSATSSPRTHFGGLRGRSPAMQSLYRLLELVAESSSPVLVVGETGTGKELVARALHDASPRAKHSFVVVDCAALPETLLDAELFGHGKGAFTGAVGERAGAFELAQDGTVFLDEIGELPLAMQPKLLRVLEAKTVRRVGESRHRSVDVRFVAATHRDLTQSVANGLFREDLFFRLNVLRVEVPPLRDRLDDLEGLVQHFLGGHDDLAPKVLAELRQRPWAGNVRELRNFVERLRALGMEAALAMDCGNGRRVAAAPAPAPTETVVDVSLSLREFRQRWVGDGEARYVSALLQRHGDNVTEAARAAGIDRTHFHRLMRKYGVERGER